MKGAWKIKVEEDVRLGFLIKKYVHKANLKDVNIDKNFDSFFNKPKIEFTQYDG